MSIVDDIRKITASIEPYLTPAAALIDAMEPSAAIPLAALIAAVHDFNTAVSPVITTAQTDAKISELESTEVRDDVAADQALTARFGTLSP